MDLVFKVDSDQVFELTTKNRIVTLATIGFTDTLFLNPISLGQLLDRGTGKFVQFVE